MRSNPGVKYRGAGGLLLAGVAVLVAASLALVAPADGLTSPDAHRFVIVHPIFAHGHVGHGGHAAHRADDGGAPAASVAIQTGRASPGVAPAGPSGQGLGLAVLGILAVLLSSLPLAAMSARLLSSRQRLAHQAWIPVPTGPPRP